MTNKHIEFLKSKIIEYLPDCKLKVINNSLLHKNHAGAKRFIEEDLPTHIKIEIYAPSLANKPRLERDRFIFKILQSEIDDYLHAIEIKYLSE